MATLRIVSETQPAAAVTERLGLDPTTINERGEQLGARTKAIPEVSGWAISSQMREPSDLSEHLCELLDLIEPRRDAVMKLMADGYMMDWFCFVEAAALEHAVELDQALLARMAAFRGPLLIDTYGTPEE